ncbi:MAG: alpha/beta hydrolase, partial [Gammaproteobacteria bacterium]|nr:alpha/beta hydrolase [Gammaproteobacteria bacterium]
LHLHCMPAGRAEDQPPLLCLHPAPYSGAWFATVMPLLNQGRVVIAPDYPGYGGSAPTETEPSIRDYADAMLDLLDDMSIARADVVGFHTGCLVGAEMSLVRADRVRRLILIDVPCFSGEERRKLYARAVTPRRFDADPAGLTEEWHRNVEQRLDAMPFDRAFELFVESLRAGDRSHWAFHAAFNYPSDERFPDLTKPVHVIATGSGLLDATRAAARLLPNVRLVECTDITRAVFEEGAGRISIEILAALGAKR